MTTNTNRLNVGKAVNLLAKDAHDRGKAAAAQEAESGGYLVRIATTLQKLGVTGRTNDGKLAAADSVASIHAAIKERKGTKDDPLGGDSWASRVQSLAYWTDAEVKATFDTFKAAAKEREVNVKPIQDTLTVLNRARKDFDWDTAKAIDARLGKAAKAQQERKAKEQAKKEAKEAMRAVEDEHGPHAVAALQIAGMGVELQGFPFPQGKRLDPRIAEAHKAALDAIRHLADTVRQYGAPIEEKAAGEAAAADTMSRLFAFLKGD